MAASVLFDAPGPKTKRRHRLYTVISSLGLLGVLGLIVFQLERKGQFAYALWEPFVTPKIINIIIEGTGKTLQAAVFAIIGALLLGMILGVGKLSEHRVLRWPAWLVVEFFRATPLLLVIIATWFYIGPEPGASAFLALVMGLILYNGAVFAEIFRAGINAVPKGQAEAAYAIGMRKSLVMRIVLIPQAVKIMLPSLISQAIVALKDTSLGYAVLAPGLTYTGKQIFGTFRNTIQTAFVIALIYITLNLLLTWLATWVQKRYVGEKTFTADAVGGIVQSQPDAGASGAGGAGIR
ncbi:amino acid ABC transporter permease [Aeromicrobium sp. A1-2]|uniref:amino acid ABC transporter permease n=1 Tax=Aeromicrobium sp. A1-2 TaxID=2107713 RepID=UPI000E51D694|nr:amino acid ABC transporter permease [Aeromicrobium sp. A1-2]AXT85191.1 amino acid ABC transporter permease [Aeromicrobium sp. A1-2]